MKLHYRELTGHGMRCRAKHFKHGPLVTKNKKSHFGTGVTLEMVKWQMISVVDPEKVCDRFTVLEKTFRRRELTKYR